MKKINLPYVFLITLWLIGHGQLSMGQVEQNSIFWQDQGPKEAVIPPYKEVAKPSPAEPSSVKVKVNATDTVAKVSKYIYGTNANIYSGTLNQEAKLVEYTKLLSPNIIRYPGGLHSNEYFWNVEKEWSNEASNFVFLNLPDDVPDQLVNSNGSTFEPWYVPGKGGWEFALDDFYDFIDKTGDEAIITVNYSYARYGTGPYPVETAAHLAAEWVRYDNGRTKFWEVGNENLEFWSSGYRIDTDLNQDGQPEIITPQLYGEHFLVFADSMHAAAAEIGHTIYIGAQHQGGYFETAGDAADYLIVHDYFTPFQTNSPPSVILESAKSTIEMHAEYAIEESNKYGLEVAPIGMTEWNIFAEGSSQASSFINGLHAVLTLGEMAKHKFGMAQRWDIANGWSNGDDFGTFSRGDDPDGEAHEWNPRAHFYHMYYFQKFFGDHMVEVTENESQDLVAYASVFSSGEAGIAIVNKGTSEQSVELEFDNFGLGDKYYVYSLTPGDDNDNFSLRTYVNGEGPTNTQLGGPIENLENLEAMASPIGGLIKVHSPGWSVQFILVENGGKEMIKVESLELESEGGANSITDDKGTLQFHASVAPANAGEQDVTWSVINESGQATISADGLLSAVADGTVKVRATANDGTGIYQEFTVTLSNQVPLGLIHDKENKFGLYPNPTSGKLFIENARDISQVVVLDVMGKEWLVQRNDQATMQVDLSKLPNGMYFINMASSGQQKFIQRVIKQ